MKKTILLTGATSGIGHAATKELVKNGYKLIFPARNTLKAQKLITETMKEGYGSLQAIKCDLSSFKSINSFVEEVKKEYDEIDILIHNAGIWNTDFKKTEDGLEETFAVNVFAPYYLTHELIPLLERGKDKKIIITSSALHKGKINFDDLSLEKNFSGFKAYQQSKLCTILLTRYFHEILKEKNISVNCFHPGMISTNIAANSNKISQFFFKLFGKSPEKGAETLLHLALNENRHLSGEYLVNKKPEKVKNRAVNDENIKKLIKQLEGFSKKLQGELV